MQVIGITGKIGSGKSTLASHLVENHGYEEYSMATPLKKIGEIFGFSQEQLYGTQEQKLQIHSDWKISAREFLQKVGTELFREKFRQTVWVDLFRIKIRENPNKKYVISDVRFQNEADVVKELGGIIIRTNRDNNVSSDSGTEHKHKSETEMNSIVPDYVMDNNKLSLLESRKYMDIILNKCIVWWAPPCAGGLGDRILGIASTFCIAKMLGREFLVKWDNTDLSSAFSINPVYNFYTYNIPSEYIQTDSKSAQAYFKETNLKTEWEGKNVMIWSNQNLFQYAWEKFISFSTHEPVYEFAWEKFVSVHESAYESELSLAVIKVFSNIFKVQENILEKLDSLPEYDVGIHIRTKDNQIYNKENEEEQRYDIWTALVSVRDHLRDTGNVSPTVFLASDCLLSHKIAKELFPDISYIEGPIVHSGTLEPEKLNTEGVRKVMLDLLILCQKCKKLYLGIHTNFSRIAGMYNLNREIYYHKGLLILGVDKRDFCNYFSLSGVFR